MLVQCRIGAQLRLLVWEEAAFSFVALGTLEEKRLAISIHLAPFDKLSWKVSPKKNFFNDFRRLFWNSVTVNFWAPAMSRVVDRTSQDFLEGFQIGEK
jgi:hypothetical protein